MARTLAKCARCGRVFSKVRSAVCVQCQDDEERDYNRIRDVLQTAPDLTPDEAAEAAGVSLRCVLRLLKEGRISSTAPGAAIPCGRCGAPAISLSKKLCERCLIDLDREFAKAVRALVTQRKLGPITTVNRTREALERKRRSTAPTPPGRVK
jgi:excisionase family DNA binding protein